jgi:hypothetical protein
MAMGFATDGKRPPQPAANMLAARHRRAGGFSTKYWTPDSMSPRSRCRVLLPTWWPKPRVDHCGLSDRRSHGGRDYCPSRERF